MAIGLNKNDYQKYGLIAAGGTAFAIFSLLFMAALIATGDVSLDDINTRKIADFLMPERELELMDDSMERPEEQEPPPDMLPPDVEMDTMEDLSGNIAPKFNFKARRQGVFAVALMFLYFKSLLSIQEELLKEELKVALSLNIP